MITRPCALCGATERDPPRDPAWARRVGEGHASWPVGDAFRRSAPAPGERVVVRLPGPLRIGPRLQALFTPWPASVDGLAEHPSALSGLAWVVLDDLADDGEVTIDGRRLAVISGRVVEVSPLPLAAEPGVPDLPSWFGGDQRYAQRTDLDATHRLVSWSMQGDVSGDLLLVRDEGGWRVMLETDDAGLHYRYAYAGGCTLDDTQVRWQESLPG